MGGGASQETSSAPWGPQAQELKRIFGEARRISGAPTDYYPGRAVAAQGPGTQEAQQAGLGLIRGNPAAGQYRDEVLGGQYLSPDTNPYLRQMGEQGAEDITRHFRTAVAPYQGFGTSRGVGSPGERNQRFSSESALGDRLGSFYSNLYGGAYQQERGYQQQAMSASPGIDASRRADIMTGSALGGQADQYQQNLINDLMARFEYERDEPANRLTQYRQNITQGVGAVPGMQQTTTSGGGGQQTTQIISSIIGAIAMAAGSFGGGAAAIPAVAGAGRMAICSRQYKNEIDNVDEKAILEAVEKLPIKIWSYKPEIDTPNHEPHIGPYAEDFQRLFGIGTGQEIFLMDGVGISLASIQHLAVQNRHLKERLDRLEALLSTTEEAA